MAKEFIALFERGLLLLELTGKVVNLCFRCLRTSCILGRLLGKGVQFLLKQAGIVLCRFELLR
jgi:hypothetical protein